MGMYVSDGNISIGGEMFTVIRKKPCICVTQRNKCNVLGTFSNKDNAEFFVDKLVELTSAKRSDGE